MKTKHVRPAEVLQPWNPKVANRVAVEPLDPSAQAAFETAMMNTRRLTEDEQTRPFSDDLG